MIITSLLLWMPRRPRAGHVLLIGLLLWPASVPALEVQPDQSHIAAALARGQAAAVSRVPPDRLYAWFGQTGELEPKGFLMTKIAGLSVLSAHFALRGETPTETDIRQILHEASLLVSVTIFGDRPDFAVETYMLLVQSDRTIKPTKVRFDARASRTVVWPQKPAYQAKVVASFPYADLAPHDKTRLSVFPPGGGEVSFDLDFSQIE
jgi:hypothetical protein